jgi:hypothetical protein
VSELTDLAALAELVRELGETGRQATPADLVRIRTVLADQALPAPTDLITGSRAGAYLLTKFNDHVLDGDEWPTGTSPEEYLDSLRATVRGPVSGVRLYRHLTTGEWMLLFVGRTRRSWAGPDGGAHVVVLFHGERMFWITGYQVRDGMSYAQRQGGWWLRRPS